jgi:hypothetical protein
VDVEASVDFAPALAAAKRQGLRPGSAKLMIEGLCWECVERER